MQPTNSNHSLKDLIQNPSPSWKVNYSSLDRYTNDNQPVFPIKGQGTVIISPLKPSDGEHISQPNQCFEAHYGFNPIEITLSLEEDFVRMKAYTIKITDTDVEFYESGQLLEKTECDPKQKVINQIDAIRWVTLDSKNGKLIYGQGEVRWETALYYVNFPSRNPRREGEDDTTLAWQHHLKNIKVDGLDEQRHLIVLRDSIYGETPLIVVPENKYTLDMADGYEQIIPANLTEECQQLYHNVAGDRMVLNDESFPYFSQAIQESIEDKNGWCYKVLEKKPEDFRYLRITFGLDVGNSPGNPYVVEIWPAHKYSPIHNHSGANAIIRVLYGEITVSLFSYFSLHNQEPFEKKTFKAGDVTFITPDLNQTHQLKNNTEDVCVTFQCYLYNKKDNNHYEYFDYLNPEQNIIGHFDPDSDSGFTDFKIQMMKEWNAKHCDKQVKIPSAPIDPLFRRKK